MTTALDTNIALVSLAEAKEFLKVTGVGDDTILNHLINGVSQWVSGYLKRCLVSKAHTEYYSGDGEMEIQLRNYPIISVTSINIDALRVFDASNAVDVSANIIIKKGVGLLRAFNLMYGFTAGESNIKIVYVAGYTVATDGGSTGTMPYTIRLAVKRILEKQYRIGYTHRKLDYASESIESMNVTFNPDAIPKDAVSLLDGYRKTIPAPQFEYAD